MFVGILRLEMFRILILSYKKLVLLEINEISVERGTITG
jgi:hypothetical protein